MPRIVLIAVAGVTLGAAWLWGIGWLPWVFAGAILLLAYALSHVVRYIGTTAGPTNTTLRWGERRAAAVKQYLMQHGIAESRMETISYGEERPIAQGSDESAWSQNRRAEFEITAGGQSLKKP